MTKPTQENIEHEPILQPSLKHLLQRPVIMAHLSPASLHLNTLEEEAPENDNIQAAEDDAEERRQNQPFAEDLGWVDRSLQDEEEGMAFQSQHSEE